MKITAVIPVRNEAETIGPLLTALTSQTLPPDEIIVVDGGSHDRTRTIVQEYTQQHPHIRLLCDPNAYPGRGRNLGAASAANEWLAFTDAGVIPAPDWLAQLSQPIGHDPSIDVVYGGWELVTETLFSECAAIAYGWIPARQFESKVDHSRAVFSSLLRQSVWQSVGGFNEELRSAEDILFMNRLDSDGFRIAYAPEAVVRWRVEPGWWRTFRRFLTYSRHNMRAGLWKHWQAPVLFRYGMLLLFAVVLLVVTKWWLVITSALLLTMLAARAIVAIRRNRIRYRAGLLRNAARLTIIVPLLATIDAATLLGVMEWFARDKISGRH
jgi:glycosyltransferase involved in cell wall biosynthesis